MKITSSKPTNRIVKLVVSVVIVATIIAVASWLYVYKFNGNILGWTAEKNASESKPAINLDKPTTDQKKAGLQTKSNSTSSTSGSDRPPAPTPIPGSSQKSVSVTITAANQNGQTLQIRALIGVVENTGVCTLDLSQSGRATVTKTAQTQALSSTSTCKGFDIPTSELTVGIWHATITYNSPALTGAATKDVTIQ